MESHVIRNIICAVLSVVVLVVFGLLAYNYKANSSDEKSRLEAAIAEAKPYEDEVTSLKRAISSATDDFYDTSETARFVIGYIISSDDDITFAEEQAAEYGFEPVLVLDCSGTLTSLQRLALTASGSGHEIMLAASAFTAESNETIKSLMTYMDQRGIAYSEIFLLRTDYYSDENVELIISDGFSGYTVYNSTPTAGVNEDGYITFDYSYLTADATSYTRFSSSYSNYASMVIAFGMDSYRGGTLTKGFMETLLGTISSYSENDDCEFSTLSQVVENLLKENESMEEKQAEFDAYIAECEARIDELEDIIAEIYAGIY